MTSVIPTGRDLARMIDHAWLHPKMADRPWRELWSLAREPKAWWIVPAVVILLLVALLAAGVSTLPPFICPPF